MPAVGASSSNLSRVPAPSALTLMTHVLPVVAAVAVGLLAMFFYGKPRKAVSVVLQGKIGTTSVAHRVKLICKEAQTHDTYVLTFAYCGKEIISSSDASKAMLGLPVGKHIALRYKGLSRPYTPISFGPGYFKLLVKIYRPVEVPVKQPGGAMSCAIDSAPLDEEMEIAGPLGMLEYCPGGRFISKQFNRSFTEIVLVGGGTGVTPMYQILNYILTIERNKNVKISLLTANRSCDDILLLDELIAIRQVKRDQLFLSFAIDRPGDRLERLGIPSADVHVGFVNEAILRSVVSKVCTNPSNCLLVACGPPPMMANCISPNISKLGIAYHHIM